MWPVALSGRLPVVGSVGRYPADYLNVHPDADFKLVAQTEDASHVAIPIVKSDDSSFLDALNSAIDELRADGTLKELGEKYFGQDISSEN